NCRIPGMIAAALARAFLTSTVAGVCSPGVDAFAQLQRNQPFYIRGIDQRARKVAMMRIALEKDLDGALIVIEGLCVFSGSSHDAPTGRFDVSQRRSEEHTSELQSRGHLVCRLLLEK